MYPHETHILDKFKDEYLSAKLILKKRFLHFITPLPAEFIQPYQPIVC